MAVCMIFDVHLGCFCIADVCASLLSAASWRVIVHFAELCVLRQQWHVCFGAFSRILASYAAYEQVLKHISNFCSKRGVCFNVMHQSVFLKVMISWISSSAVRGKMQRLGNLFGKIISCRVSVPVCCAEEDSGTGHSFDRKFWELTHYVPSSSMCREIQGLGNSAKGLHRGLADCKGEGNACMPHTHAFARAWTRKYSVCTWMCLLLARKRTLQVHVRKQACACMHEHADVAWAVDVSEICLRRVVV